MATAATAGAAFASGREVGMFFSQMGWASWIGVGCASAMFGLFCGIICRFARQTGAKSFAAVYMRVLDMRQGAVVGAVHGLLMALTAGVMMAAVGELAALALPLYNAFWMGVLFSTGIALLLNLRGMRAMIQAGLPVIALCAVFYAALALDPRKTTVHFQYETVPELSGSVSAALLLAALHSALCASVSGGVAARMAGDVSQPMRFGARCGAMMLALLSAGNAALLRGGEKLLSQALPTVLLAARWGKAGFYISIFVMWICSTMTLSAALGTLVGQLDDGRCNRRILLLTLMTGMTAALLMGFGRLVEVGYPMLGWASLFALTGLGLSCGRPTRKNADHDRIAC